MHFGVKTLAGLFNAKLASSPVPQLRDHPGLGNRPVSF